MFETFYAICFVAGAVYGLVMSFLSGALGFDHGGHEVDLGSGDFSSHPGMSPLSPVVIATFLTMFGGAGVISIQLFEIDPVVSLLPALVIALATGAAVFYLVSYIFVETQGGVEMKLSDLVGSEAEVIVSIPTEGMGEIAISGGGGRMNCPARSESGQPIPTNTTVTISKIVGNTYIVRPFVAPAPPATTGG